MLTPLPNESQAEFAVRFHEGMVKEIPETDTRDSAMMNEWRGHRGPSALDRQAHQHFSKDHVCRNDVPIFVEHTTEDPDGNTVIYDRSALMAVLDRNNRRISDTGDFSPITDGHTPDSEAMSGGAKMPDVLGYAGPFRLGQVGNEKARYAIFATEWHDKSDIDRLRKLRRRSPEVWMEERMEERFFDPIAALGAETPRLDVGMTRFRRFKGKNVMKYSAAAFPAAANTFVPNETETKKNQAETDLMITPEDTQQIIDAFMETAPMKYIINMMAESGEGAPQAMPGGTATTVDPGAGAAPAAPSPEELEEDKSQIAKYMAGDCDEKEMEQYRHHRKKQGYQAGENYEEKTDVESYSRRARVVEDKARYTKLESQVQSQEKELASLRHEKTRSDRYAKLQEIRRTSAIDVEDEIKICDPEKMTDELFDVHVASIQKYARIPVDQPALWTPDEAIELTDQDKASAALSDKAVQYCKRMQTAGKHVSYDEAMAHLEKESVASA